MQPEFEQTVWVMVGLIGSGKSSWAKMKSSSNSMVSIVCKDDIRKMLYGEYKFDEMTENLVDDIANAAILEVLGCGRSLVVDECHLTVESRHNLVHLIREEYPSVPIVGVWCKNESHNLENRMKSPKDIPEYTWQQVLRRMISILERPTASEFDELIKVV